MTFKTFIIIWALCTLCFPSVLFAGKLTPVEVASRIQAVYDKTSSMTANFTQVTSSPMSRREKEGSGRLIFLKPGKMRWDYVIPDEQVIVCDGTDILMYFSKESQMLISSAKEYLEHDVTYSFFAGTGNLLRDFEVGYPEEESFTQEEGDIVMRLQPKGKQPQIDYVLIWAGKDYSVKRIIVVNQFGSSTDISFSHVQLNSEIPAASFLFTPPAGTEIIKQ